MKRISYALIASALFASAASAGLTASSSPASSSSAHLANPAACANFNGFFAGALLGYGSGQGKVSGESEVAVGAPGVLVPALMTLKIKEFDLSLKGGNAGLLLGYGRTLGNSKVYLGFDFGFTFNQESGTSFLVLAASQVFLPIQVTYGILSKIEVKRRNALQLGPRLGLVFGNALIFAKLGWENAQFRIKTLEHDVYFTGSPFTFSKRLDGFYAGLGVDLKLTKNVLAGIQYTFTSFKHETKIKNQEGQTLALKMRPMMNAVQFKVAYQF